MTLPVPSDASSSAAPAQPQQPTATTHTFKVWMQHQACIVDPAQKAAGGGEFSFVCDMPADFDLDAHYARSDARRLQRWRTCHDDESVPLAKPPVEARLVLANQQQQAAADAAAPAPQSTASTTATPQPSAAPAASSCVAIGARVRTLAERSMGGTSCYKGRKEFVDALELGHTPSKLKRGWSTLVSHASDALDGELPPAKPPRGQKRPLLSFVSRGFDVLCQPGNEARLAAARAEYKALARAEYKPDEKAARLRAWLMRAQQYADERGMEDAVAALGSTGEGAATQQFGTFFRDHATAEAKASVKDKPPKHNSTQPSMPWLRATMPIFKELLDMD